MAQLPENPCFLMKRKLFCEGIIRKGQLGVKYNLRWGCNAGDIFQGLHAFRKNEPAGQKGCPLCPIFVVVVDDLSALTTGISVCWGYDVIGPVFIPLSGL